MASETSSRMTFAITIGCYRLTDFIELNINACREWFGSDVPILLSDDLAPESEGVKRLAERYDCSYVGTDSRMSHFSGDLQAIINSLVFAQMVTSDVALKLSQRLVPNGPGFRAAVGRAFEDPNIIIAVPGKPPAGQIASRMSLFYHQFEILTDAVAIRRGHVDPNELATLYRERVSEGKARMDCLVETTIHHLIHTKLQSTRHRVLPEWSEHKIGEPKQFIRKAQSSKSDYELAAKRYHLGGEFNLSEWAILEGPGYVARAHAV